MKSSPLLAEADSSPVPTKTAMSVDPLKIGSQLIHSRLIVGTGKYSSLELMRDCHMASGAEVVTVAVRRERLMDKNSGRNILDFIDPNKYVLLPNTAGCFDADEVVRVARLGREMLTDSGYRGANWVKLECLGDTKTLLPDPVGTLKALDTLVADGFEVLVYCSDDVMLCRQLKKAGAAAVMPAGSPIGSGQGVLNANAIKIIVEILKGEDVTYPIILDAGVGTASDVAAAMELGIDGVLLNTAVAGAKDPVSMAHAMRLATEAGLRAFRAGRIPRKLYATASSPWEGRVNG